MMASIQILLSFLVVLTMSVLISGDFNVVILHTNDVHARIEQTNKYSSNCSQSDADDNKCYGGVARRYSAIEQIRSNYSNVILLDAGDQFQGTAWFSYYAGLEASYFMNELNYDVMVLGNHEFDNGVDGLLPFLRNVTFPVLACNLDASQEPELQSQILPYVILDVDGQKIGVIGYITKETSFLVRPDYVKSLIFKDEIPSVQQYVTQLESEGVNKIIVLSHSGIEIGQQVAKEVTGVDIIIEGHSNTFLYTGEPPSNEDPVDKYPVVISQDDGGQALLYSAYAYGKYLGMADVTFDDTGAVKAWSGNPILLDGSWEQDEAVLERVVEWRKPLAEYALTEAGETYVMLDGEKKGCRTKECNLGSFITDAILDQHLRSDSNGTSWSDVGIVLVNGGGIRSSQAVDKLNVGNMLEILPFRNEVERVTIKGRYLRQMFEHSVTDWNPADPEGRFLQVSGIQVTYNLDRPEGSRVHDVMVRCTECLVPRFEPLEDEKVYAVLTNRYMVLGGDGYSMLRDNIIEHYHYGNLWVDSLTEYVKRVTPIWPGEEGRIRFVTDEDIPINGSDVSRQSLPMLMAMFLLSLMYIILS